MCELGSLIYRLVISKSVKVASSYKQGWQCGTVCLNFCYEVWYAGTVRLFCDGPGTVRFKNWTEVRYGSKCEVRSTQILNVPYRTAILGFNCHSGWKARFCNFTTLQKEQKAFGQADKAFVIKQIYKLGRINWHQCSQNLLRIKEVENSQKVKNSLTQRQFSGSYKRKCNLRVKIIFLRLSDLNIIR